MSNQQDTKKKNPNVPTLRFIGFNGEWTRAIASEVLETLSNNTLSRDCLNYVSGKIKNIHYGDVLINYPTFLDVNSPDVPFVNDGVACKSDRLQNGDVVIADTAEDYEAGKALEIVGHGKTEVVAGLHTVPCRTRRRFATGYLGYYLNSKPYKTRLVPFIQGIKVYSVSRSNLLKTEIVFPSLEEQAKIASLLIAIDKRISAQNKIIEGLESLEKGIIHRLIWGQECGKAALGELLSERTEKTSEQNQFVILSSSATGLFTQEEYFNHQVASENNVGYKIVRKGDVILSPQNLWLGNINYNDRFECGMVSPSYKVFSIKGCHAPFLSLFLKTKRMKYLYGLCSEQGASVVRRNLNVEEFLQIAIPMPPMEVQKAFAEKILTIKQKHRSESKYRDLLLLQKKYLLENMFI